MNTLVSIDDIKANIRDNDIYVVVFTTKSCSVCKPLKEKLEKVLTKFDMVTIADVYIDDLEEAKGAYQVYTVPIILLFIQGQESKRYSAAMDIVEFEKTIRRYVELIGI